MRNVVFASQEWARHAYAERGEQQAKIVLRGQLRRFPELADIRDVANNHARHVFVEWRDEGEFEKALGAIDSHREFLAGDEELLELRQNVFDTWARSFMKQRKWSEASDVYQAGLQRLPGNKHLQRNLVYVVQEWSRDVLSQAGASQAKQLLIDQIARFPDIGGIRDVAENHARRVVYQTLDEGEYEKSLQTIDNHKPLFDDERDSTRLVQAVFDRWSAARGKDEGWQAAIDVYAAGLARLPGDRHLTRNAVASWHQWARPHIDSKEWSVAIDIYERALQHFPEDSTLKNNLRYCRQQLDQ